MSSPIALIEEQAAELVPIGYGRMSASSFAVFVVRPISMASDLVGAPQTGIRVQLCGDAHLASFGGVTSLARQAWERNIFDILLSTLTASMRHFPGPWEGM